MEEPKRAIVTFLNRTAQPQRTPCASVKIDKGVYLLKAAVQTPRIQILKHREF